MNMKISFIVPVYNVEEYLARCLESILAVKSVDWECILIDDGSTDGSWKMIRAYSEKYPDKFIAQHKENGGVSSARNMGLELVTGDRIMFVDPDDYLFPEADGFFEYVMNEFDDKDQILYKYLMVYDDGSVKEVRELQNIYSDYNEMIFQNALIGFWAASCTLQLFKTSIVKKYNIRFDESMRIREDLNFSLDYIIHSCSAAPFDKSIYAYYQRGNSAVTKICESDWDDVRKYFNKCNQVIAVKNIKMDKRRCDELNFYRVRITVSLFVYLYKELPLHKFKSKCREIFSIKEFKEVVERGGRYLPLYFFLKYKLYTLFWILVRSYCLFGRLKRK